METELKRLSYVSRSVAGDTSSVPAELTAIVMQSRRFNHAHGITGFLTWRNGYYFQALEGPVPAVDSLYQKIADDDRHSQITDVWNEYGVQDRIFSGWRLKLWSASLTCSEVNRYIRLHERHFANLDEDIKQRLSRIFQLDLIFNSEPGDLPDRHAILDYEFQLQALPSVFGLTGQHPQCIDVLTSLLAGWVSPAHLAERFKLSVDDLYDLLSRSEVNSLLLKRSAQSSQASSEISQVESIGESSHGRSFYDRLRAVFMAPTQ